MQAGYFKTAWNDIKSTPGWVGKMFLLALIMCIPIFGQIVVTGYLYGWARDAAWGVQGPMPKRIFGNEDGKLYSRGFFILVLGIVLALIPGIIYSIYAMITGFGTVAVYGRGDGSSFGAFAFMGLFGLLFLVLYWVLLFAVTFFQWVGSMRISIYGRLSSGFQFKKIWAMIRKDFVGLLKIFGMVLLVGLIIGVIASILFSLVFAIILAVAFGMAGSGINMGYDYLDRSVISMILAVGGVAIFLILILSYLVMVPLLWIEALCVRALGYWTRQFDVPAWRGQDDPMPFELQQAAQRASAGSPPPYQRATPMPQQQQPQPPQQQQYRQPDQEQPQQASTQGCQPSGGQPAGQSHVKTQAQPQVQPVPAPEEPAGATVESGGHDIHASTPTTNMPPEPPHPDEN